MKAGIITLDHPVWLRLIQDGSRTKRVELAAGEYELIEVPNPLIRDAVPWLVLAGWRKCGWTLGLTAEGWDRAVARSKKWAKIAPQLEEPDEADTRSLDP